jgi:hypothetical protein
MDETTRATFDRRDREAVRDLDNLPAIAPAVAALTLAAAAMTLVAGIWLLRARRRDDKRADFPAPAIHRR